MDPPPIHVQIQPHHARRQRGSKGKGAFAKVSTTIGRKTSNYRIRTLADGRIGQQHVIQRQRIVAANEPQDDNPGTPSDDPQPRAPDPKAPPKPKRVRNSNTWAVRSLFFRNFYFDYI